MRTHIQFNTNGGLCSSTPPRGSWKWWWTSPTRDCPPWLEPTFPYLCTLHFAMGTLVDNGGCYFNGEIKSWLPFRQKLYRSSDDMGLGWVYEIVNVLSTYLQKKVPEMSKKDRETGDIATDFEKFSDAQLKMVVIVLSKSQGSFLLSNPSSIIAKTRLGRATWTMSNVDTVKRKILPKTMNNVILHTSSRLNVCERADLRTILFSSSSVVRPLFYCPKPFHIECL
jgi:hypothetical protein